MSKRTICFESPEDLIDLLDGLAEQAGISRSDVIRSILKNHVGESTAHETVMSIGAAK
jgi:metal-responsive CopG/Arc/MetJ family transcriptional regulator